MHETDPSTHQPQDDPFHAGGSVRRTPSGRVVDAAAEPGERQYALWIHVGPGIAWIAVSASSGIAFVLPILVALVLWLARRHDSPFLDDHGRQAVNFQISLLLLSILFVVGLFFSCIGIPLIPLALIGLTVLAIVGTVLAAVAAHKGEYFRYPMTWEFIPPPKRV